MLSIELYQGKSKKGNKFEAVKVRIGDWETLVFPKSQFEMNYIKGVLADEEGTVNVD